MVFIKKQWFFKLMHDILFLSKLKEKAVTKTKIHPLNGIIFFKTKRNTMKKELKPISLSPQISESFLKFMEDYSTAMGYKKFKKNSIIVELATITMNAILEESKPGEVNYSEAIKSLKSQSALIKDIEELLEKYKSTGG